ncbi:MAG: hypothetical protein OXU20_41140 [Myxococcales bacterium]|nr:hypothetical protein [Myxococcales bacterium]
MAMVRNRWTSIALVATVLGCAGSQSADGVAQPSATEGPPWEEATSGGAATSCAPCPSTEEIVEVRLDDPSLGFTPRDVVDYFAGQYGGTVLWRTPCDQDDCHSPTGECSPDIPDFAGTTTRVQVDVRQIGKARIERCPDYPKDSACGARRLYVPFEVAFATADGILEASVRTEAGITPDCCSDLGGTLESSDVRGSLGDLLAAGTTTEWQIDFHGGAITAGLWVSRPTEQPGAAAEVLKLEGIPDSKCDETPLGRMR